MRNTSLTASLETQNYAGRGHTGQFQRHTDAGCGGVLMASAGRGLSENGGGAVSTSFKSAQSWPAQSKNGQLPRMAGWARVGRGIQAGGLYT